MMFTQKVTYLISTTIKNDEDSVEKCIKSFNSFTRDIQLTDLDYVYHVTITPVSCESRTIQLSGENLDLCSPTWEIIGEKDIVERFLQECKTKDQNPYQRYRIEEVVSFSSFMRLMELKRIEAIGRGEK